MKLTGPQRWNRNRILVKQFETKIAKKRHECAFCFRLIKPRQTYFYWEYMPYRPDHRRFYSSIKLHMHCYSAMLKVTASELNRIHKEVFM